MRAAIFDIDGTIIDSVDLHAKAWQEAFQHFGYNFSFDETRSQIGKGGDQLLPALLPKNEADAKGKEISDYRSKLFKQKYMSQVKPFPQVRPLFQRLLAGGWKIALASSAKGDELEKYKQMAQVADLLAAQTSSDDAEKSKPNPDIFLAALEHLGNPDPQDCLVVGDSPYDAEAASKAGMQAIGVLCGGFKLDELKGAGYKGIFKDPADLLARYDEAFQLEEYRSALKR